MHVSIGICLKTIAGIVTVLGGIGASLENVGCADGTANSYIYIESCFNKGYVDSSVNYCSDQIGGINITQ